MSMSMSFLPFLLLFGLFPFHLSLAHANSHSDPFEKNLAYRSPFEAHPQFELKVKRSSIPSNEKGKRAETDASPFKDGHYATFYGASFANSPTVWTGLNFTHSVASGDPWATSVLLWTRAVPIGPGSPAMDSVPACVGWGIASSPSSLDSSSFISSGQAFTSYDVDWTVKVEADGLMPDVKYWYRFWDCADKGKKSPVGVTRTLPSADTPANQVNGGKALTIAVFSCSDFAGGYFNAYHYAALNTSADLFVHLGDYIYETLGDGASIGRKVTGRELATIADYRQRMAQYRTDVGLLAAHQNAPWIAVWDDHEVADNAWKAGTANSNDTEKGCKFSPSGACFTDRKFAAVRAYHEWMPIRQVASDDKLRIWRNFQIGKLLDLTMLDTRQYDRDITDVYYNRQYVDSLADYTNRSIMGLAQERWLYQTLSESKSRGAVWRVIGQQVVFTSIKYPVIGFNNDQWDGYRANRGRLLSHMQENKIDNVVVLAGDSHANWVSDLAFPNATNYDPKTGSGALGVEFAGTAVTSGSAFGKGIPPIAADAISAVLVGTNTDLQWSEGSYRGFFTLTVDPALMKATYYGMKDISKANLNAFATAVFTVEAGGNKLQRPVAGGKVEAGILKSRLPFQRKR